MGNKCSECAQFVTIVDRYLPWQDPNDKEPVKEIQLCQSCVDKDVQAWKELGWMPKHKVKAKYEQQLAKDMGFVWKENGFDGHGVWIKPVKIKSSSKFIKEEVIDDIPIAIFDPAD